MDLDDRTGPAALGSIAGVARMKDQSNFYPDCHSRCTMDRAHHTGTDNHHPTSNSSPNQSHYQLKSADMMDSTGTGVCGQRFVHPGGAESTGENRYLSLRGNQNDNRSVQTSANQASNQYDGMLYDLFQGEVGRSSH